MDDAQRTPEKPIESAPALATQQVPIGATVYTKRTLRYYDFVVHGLSDRLVWRCPRSRIVEFNRRYVAANHLELGVGSGGLFRQIGDQRRFERLVIADVNPNCLSVAQHLLKSWRPEVAVMNLLAEEIDLSKFGTVESIGINFVLHCLPLPFPRKLTLLDRIRTTGLAAGGSLIGSTILPRQNAGSWSRRVMEFYNHRKIFCNLADQAEVLQEFVQARHGVFEARGCVALFQLPSKPG